jgi:hypothetical protein
MAFGSRQAVFLSASTPPVDETPNYLAALLQIAETLRAPNEVKSLLRDLAVATKAHNDAAAAARAQQAKTEAEVERARLEHRQQLDREVAVHSKAIASERVTAEADRKAAAHARQAAEADRKIAAELKAAWERKMQAFDAA